MFNIKNINIISQIKDFDIKQLRHVNIEKDNIKDNESVESDITVEYEFNFDTDNDSDDYIYDISIADIIHHTFKLL